jgi:biotin-[acetyl-CoA-carboxylase] ligase BirA-like protein
LAIIYQRTPDFSTGFPPQKFMKIYTDNIFCCDCIPSGLAWKKISLNSMKNHTKTLAQHLFLPEKEIYEVDFLGLANYWKFLFITEYAYESQYDVVVNLLSNSSVYDGILCLATQGKKFHGFHNRSWEACPGNLHLIAMLCPQKEIPNFNVNFLLLSVVSILQTMLDFLPLKNKASIKWINDILIEGKKVGGTLTHAQIQGKKVMNVVLGIGINIETTPEIKRNEFVPPVSCLRNFTQQPHLQEIVFKNLTHYLATNYSHLLNSNCTSLFSIYHQHSFILNREIILYDDPFSILQSNKICQGIVTNITENLELVVNNAVYPATGRIAIL